MITRLKNLFRKEVCPYCFEEYRLKDTPFRCASPGSRCELEVDEVRRRIWEDGMPMGRVLEPPGKLVDEIRCSKCSQISRKRLCPQCHMELPHTTGKFENLIFAVIGAKDSGKSHYIAVLIDQLRKNVGPGMNMLLEPLDDATIKRYREAFHDPLYRDGRVIHGTVSALADRKAQMPLVYSLTFGGRGPFGGRRVRKAVTLVFFDTAGEDLDDENTMATVNKYIYRSNGIILLLDPLQLPRVRNQLDKGTPLPRESRETSDIITRVSRLILAGRRMAPDAMVPIPLAVAFSKFDAVEPLVDPQLQLSADANHDGAYDVADFEAVDAEMRSLLAQWDSESIPHQVHTRFKYFGFFGLSALGCNPHGDQKVPRVLPRRVEDPYLWLLYQHGLIHAVGQRFWQSFATLAGGRSRRGFAVALMGLSAVFGLASGAVRLMGPGRPVGPSMTQTSGAVPGISSLPSPSDTALEEAASTGGNERILEPVQEELRRGGTISPELIRCEEELAETGKLVEALSEEVRGFAGKNRQLSSELVEMQQRLAAEKERRRRLTEEAREDASAKRAAQLLGSVSELVAAIHAFDRTHFRCKRCSEDLGLKRKKSDEIVNFHASVIQKLNALQSAMLEN